MALNQVSRPKVIDNDSQLARQDFIGPYDYDSIDKCGYDMKLRHPGLIKLIGLLASVLIRLWMSTVRLRIRMHDDRTDPDHRRCRGHFIHAFWHEDLLALTSTPYRNPVHILISLHADGELIAQVIRWLGIKSVRGSSTRGGGQALMQMLELGARSHLAVTPDGPRGPRRTAQRGTIFLASQLAMPIVPYGLAYSWAWRAKSWDRMAIPLPFSTLYGITGPELAIPAYLHREDQQKYAAALQTQMNLATEQAKAWCVARHGHAC